MTHLLIGNVNYIKGDFLVSNASNNIHTHVNQSPTTKNKHNGLFLNVKDMSKHIEIYSKRMWSMVLENPQNITNRATSRYLPIHTTCIFEGKKTMKSSTFPTQLSIHATITIASTDNNSQRFSFWPFLGLHY